MFLKKNCNYILKNLFVKYIYFVKFIIGALKFVFMTEIYYLIFNNAKICHKKILSYHYLTSNIIGIS